MYLMGLIEILPIQRRRHGAYEDAAMSRRQVSVSFTVPDGKGSHKRVCKKTFMNIFGIQSSKKIELLIKKKEMW